MEDRMMTCLSPRLACMMQEKRSDLAGGQIIMQELAYGRHVHRRIVRRSLVTAAVSAPPPPSPSGGSSDQSRPPTEVKVITPDCCARPCLSHAKIRGKRASAGRGRMPKCGEARSIEEGRDCTGHGQMRPYSGLSNTGDRPRSWHGGMKSDRRALTTHRERWHAHTPHSLWGCGIILCREEGCRRADTFGSKEATDERNFLFHQDRL
ncbi:hypothetical protein IWZ00DRAFT_520645 [Phyllosticta capitalensis]|uniref:uncharacterized protein n=1 Tax=Phyllosticta capitalensis TaxID=121624 RepID=UPI00312D57A6